MRYTRQRFNDNSTGGWIAAGCNPADEPGYFEGESDSYDELVEYRCDGQCHLCNNGDRN